jgi:bisphosphoglycerate-dependent phosphoglycerate mutase
MRKTKIIKNFTMHEVELNREVMKTWEVENPSFNKMRMILSTDAIIKGKSTTAREQKAIMKKISPYINKGDNILVAGHNTVVTSVEIVAQIKGANVYVGYLHKDSKKIIKIDKKIICPSDISRAERYEIEHGICDA